MIRLGIIFGGKSGEHDVSLMSATSVIKAVDRSKFEIIMIGITKDGRWLLYDGPVEEIESGGWQRIAEDALKNNPEKYRFTVVGAGGAGLRDVIDFALPILHGPYGEDGTIQGLFEMADIPYGGCGVLGSSLAMDKSIAKAIFSRENLPQCRYVNGVLEDIAEDMDGFAQRVEGEMPYPVFVKPANMGSSVGISKAKDREGLKRAIEEALIYDRRIIIEEGLNVREVETAILGNHSLKAAVVGEVIPSAEFYDYKAKYLDGGQSVVQVPADITKEQADRVKEIALKAYRALDCSGFARIDCFLEKDTGKIYINEINTIPGFTKYSMFPVLFKAAGVEYSRQIERIVELGYERYNVKNRRETGA